MYDEETGNQESGGPSGGFGQRIKSVLLLCAFLGLTFALLYFVAQQNAGRYFLVAEEGNLVVKRGIFFPVGEKPYTPDEPRLARAYASIPLPPEGFEAGKISFEERADLDQALFDLLLGWARDRIQSGDSTRLERGISYLRRAESLPAYTLTQEQSLAALEGQVAFYEAEHLLREGARQVGEAARRLDRARATGVIDDRSAEALAAGAREQLAGLEAFIETVHTASSTVPPATRPEGEAPTRLLPETIPPEVREGVDASPPSDAEPALETGTEAVPAAPPPVPKRAARILPASGGVASPPPVARAAARARPSPAAAEVEPIPIPAGVPEPAVPASDSLPEVRDFHPGSEVE